MGDFLISAKDLSYLVSTAAPLRIFDVRRHTAITPSSRFLPGSRWRNHLNCHEWAERLTQDRLIIVNCLHGHNVSQLAATSLREAGYDARVLSGGVEGWTSLGLPSVGQCALAGIDAGPSRWITATGPDTVGAASTWLLKRFIDPDACFYCAEANWVEQIADELAATAYNVPGAFLSGSRDQNSFEMILNEFDLHDPVLTRMARTLKSPPIEVSAIIRGNSLTGGAPHTTRALNFALFDALYAQLANGQDKS